MTRWFRRLSTGSNPAGSARVPGPSTILVLLVSFASILSAPAKPARAQALQLQSLDLPASPVVGPWVRYRVRTQTRSRPVREYTQRVAIVGKETVDGHVGYWVELKTEGQPSGTRIERGFLFPPGTSAPAPAPDEGDASSAPEDGAAALPPTSPTRRTRLERYQVLQSNGKLYEYPAEKLTELRSGGDVGTIELFEFDTAIPALVEDLGPDTLRSAARVVPAVVVRTRRAGADDWPTPGDTASVNRPLLVQTVWKNGAVPITGIARSLFQVTTERVPASARDTTPIQGEAPPRPDITGSAASSLPPAQAPQAPARPPFAPSPASAAGAAIRASAPVISWTDLVLLDLGADAVPEVTQTPEPLPDASSPAGPGGTGGTPR
jgi:hypothetical protein